MTLYVFPINGISLHGNEGNAAMFEYIELSKGNIPSFIQFDEPFGNGSIS